MTRRHSTADRGPPSGDRVRAVHTVHQIGPSRSLLPNGNLLCKDVPIARSGWLLYGPQEVPVKPAANGIVYIERTTDQLFNPVTMASFETAAVTNDHPIEDVTPLTWNGLAGGFAINVRQGTGDDADVLLADLMITDAKLIKLIGDGKIEVSAGYDADYEDLGNGVGRQSNIIGNHIALVEKGRCGPRCAIGDQAYFVPTTAKEISMPKARTPLSRQRVALIDDAELEAKRQKVRDAQAELEEAEAEHDEDQGDGQHIHIHLGGDGERKAAKTGDAMGERLTKVESDVGEIKEGIALLLAGKTIDKAMAPPKGKKKDDEEEEEEEEEEDDKATAKKTGDSKALATGYAELQSQAEILVPGFKTPTFDADLTRASTVDRMCNVRRKVLDQFGATEAGQAILLAANGGKPVDLLSMGCDEVGPLFKNAATAKGAVNNHLATRDSAAMKPGAATMGAIKGLPTLEQMNEQAAKFWEGK